MGRPDIHSFANFDEVVVRHLALKLECDFSKKRFFGSVDIKAEVLKPGTEYICLDVDALDIQSVKDASGADLAYDMPEKGLFGSMMRVKLPSGAKNVVITVTYRYEFLHTLPASRTTQV
jgi:aminopeptidase N